MAIARNTTAETIKPLQGHIVRRFTCGSAIAAGEVVSLSADGFIDPADTTSAAAQVVGIALQLGVVTQVIDVVVFGPVVCVTGGTPGTTVHASNAPGEPAESAGTNAGILGFVEQPTVLFVRPVSA